MFPISSEIRETALRDAVGDRAQRHVVVEPYPVRCTPGAHVEYLWGMTADQQSDSDESLLAQWRAGDAEVGNRLFRRHFRAIRRFFRNKVPAGEVEELIQRTFVGCVEARERIRGDFGFRPFLFAVARRQLYKYLRARASHERRVDVDLGVSSVHDLGQSPSSALAKHERHQILLLALQRVSVEHQTMLELFYWEQLGGAEIAAVLDIAPATVRTRLFRGRQAVHKAFVELSAGRYPLDGDVAAEIRSAGEDL